MFSAKCTNDVRPHTLGLNKAVLPVYLKGSFVLLTLKYRFIFYKIHILFEDHWKRFCKKPAQKFLFCIFAPVR